MRGITVIGSGRIEGGICGDLFTRPLRMMASLKTARGFASLCSS